MFRCPVRMLIAFFLPIAWTSFALAGVLPGMLADIPVYPNARVTMIQEGEVSSFVTMETAAPPEAIVKFYRTRLEEDGWTVELEIVTGSGAAASFSREPSEQFELAVEQGTRDINLITTTITRGDP